MRGNITASREIIWIIKANSPAAAAAAATWCELPSHWQIELAHSSVCGWCILGGGRWSAGGR